MVGGQDSARSPADELRRPDVELGAALLAQPVPGSLHETAQLHDEVPGVVGAMRVFPGDEPHAPGESGHDRCLYVVSHWIDGDTLVDWRHRRDRSFDDICGVPTGLATIVDGLATREQPVVHRDISPDNVVVRPDGKVRLIDFTFVRPPNTAAGTVAVFKGGYTAPEAGHGEVGLPADRYSFGAVAYYLLAGSEPAVVDAAADSRAPNLHAPGRRCHPEPAAPGMVPRPRADRVAAVRRQPRPDRWDDHTGTGPAWPRHGADRGRRRQLPGPTVTDQDWRDFPPHVLREYALLADGERGALCGPRGDLAWLCAPGWDDDAVLSTLVGGGGTYSVSPVDNAVWGGYYESGTLIWRNRWVTTGTIVECRDALAFPGDPHRVVVLRRVDAVDHDVTVRVQLDARDGYGRRRMRQAGR